MKETETMKADVSPSDASGCSGADVDVARSVAGMICKWCDEAPLELFASHRGFHVGCSAMFSSCPDTTGACRTAQEAFDFAKVAFE